MMVMRILPVLTCFAFLRNVQAVSPLPDRCYPNFTTAEGCNALQSLTTGAGNTGIGWYSLFANSTGSYNTAVGAGALDVNTASNNTGTGAGALLLNTTGNNNTANGVDALALNTTGTQNTANGAFALYGNSAGGGNIAIGDQAGYDLAIGSNNIMIGNIGVPAESDTIRIGDPAIHTAIFVAGITKMSPTEPNQVVLLNPTTGQLGGADISSFGGVVSTDPGNTAVGVQALISNTGGDNTATGYQARMSNTSGSDNVAVGTDSLFLNDSGADNNAIGSFALFNNSVGNFNNAHGRDALFDNLGSENNAFGDLALEFNTTGAGNSAFGDDALDSCDTGSENVAIGDEAGNSITTGSNNVCIGASAGIGIVNASNVTCIGANVPAPDVSNRCYIGQIFGVTSSGGTGVFINSSGQLGTVMSSGRFKEEIKPMDKASEVLLALNPITFRYKKAIDPERTPQFGLVAEDVEKVNPDLIVRDKEGKAYSVRYEAVNAMLLNEFLKEHRKVEQLEKQIEALTAGLQKVSAQLELSKSAPQTVSYNH